MLEGKPVCTEAFTSILEMSRKRYQKLLRQYKEGATKFKRKEARRRSTTNKVTEAQAWMRYFFERNGDRMPHVQQIHLPHFLTKRDNLLSNEEGALEGRSTGEGYRVTLILLQVVGSRLQACCDSSSKLYSMQCQCLKKHLLNVEYTDSQKLM